MKYWDDVWDSLQFPTLFCDCLYAVIILKIFAIKFAAKSSKTSRIGCFYTTNFRRGIPQILDMHSLSSARQVLADFSEFRG